MTCAPCTKNVERTSKKQPGILVANINLANERAGVRYIAGTVNRAQIIWAVEDAGYVLSILAQLTHLILYLTPEKDKK